MLILAVLSRSTTLCMDAAGAEGSLAGAGAEAAAASPGRQALKSRWSIGFIVEPKRDASSETMAASTRLGPVCEAINIPATCLFPAGRLSTVKKTASEFEPRTLKTLPIWGRSPQLFCTERSTFAMAAAFVFAPSTTP
jgi:hypothetical protein